jgi:hypothetical protein
MVITENGHLDRNRWRLIRAVFNPEKAASSTHAMPAATLLAPVKLCSVASISRLVHTRNACSQLGLRQSLPSLCALFNREKKVSRLA